MICRWETPLFANEHALIAGFLPFTSQEAERIVEYSPPVWSVFPHLFDFRSIGQPGAYFRLYERDHSIQ